MSVLLPFDKTPFESSDNAFIVAKTLLGQSSVLVSVPPPNVKLLALPD